MLFQCPHPYCIIDIDTDNPLSRVNIRGLVECSLCAKIKEDTSILPCRHFYCSPCLATHLETTLNPRQLSPDWQIFYSSDENSDNDDSSIEIIGVISINSN